MSKRKNPAAVALGRRGGLESARVAALDPDHRREMRQRAARARWQRERERREHEDETAQ